MYSTSVKKSGHIRATFELAAKNQVISLFSDVERRGGGEEGEGDGVSRLSEFGASTFTDYASLIN